MRRNSNIARLVAATFLTLAVFELSLTGQSPALPGTHDQMAAEAVDEARKIAPAERKIREVLRGNEKSVTGNGMLDDVLGLIQREGSVLEGSMLDEPIADQDLDQSHGKESTQKINSQRAFAAEQLLRAARLLSKVETGDDSSELIDAMIEQATELLLEIRNE